MSDPKNNPQEKTPIEIAEEVNKKTTDIETMLRKLELEKEPTTEEAAEYEAFLKQLTKEFKKVVAQVRNTKDQTEAVEAEAAEILSSEQIKERVERLNYIYEKLTQLVREKEEKERQLMDQAAGYPGSQEMYNATTEKTETVPGKQSEKTEPEATEQIEIPEQIAGIKKGDQVTRGGLTYTVNFIVENDSLIVRLESPNENMQSFNFGAEQFVKFVDKGLIAKIEDTSAEEATEDVKESEAKLTAESFKVGDEVMCMGINIKLLKLLKKEVSLNLSLLVKRKKKILVSRTILN